MFCWGMLINGATESRMYEQLNNKNEVNDVSQEYTSTACKT